ncbi:MAG TPA: diaminopimelate decarboxylase [Gemmatimonadota bacterium]|nr:diaminopimelate decarboxylase [Gemmatimonadota bacterium]
MADRHGTPLYVTDAGVVRDRWSRLRAAFPEAEIHYAAKANTNPALLRVLREEGAGLDAVSEGEVVAGLRAGFPPEAITYTGVFPSDEELEAVLARDTALNADSEHDVERIARMAPGRDIGLRMNPGVGAGHHEHVVTGGPAAKFGIPAARIGGAWRRAAALGVRPAGLHMHIGSGISEPEIVREALARLARALEEVAAAGPEPRFADIGGGIPVPYLPGEAPADLEGLAAAVDGALGRGRRLVLEPGRYLVAESTVLVARVTGIKEGFVGVDAGFHTLLRPALYGARHHVSNLTRPDAEPLRVDVAGPLCESGDLLARDRTLPRPEPGDLLAVHTAGAYGFSMASRYNSRPLPAEVLVDGRESRLVRERESLEELFARVREA